MQRFYFITFIACSILFINNILIIVKVSKEEIEFNKKNKQHVYFFDNLEVGKDQRQNGFLKKIEKIEKMPNLEFNVTISDPDNEKQNYNKYSLLKLYISSHQLLQLLFRKIFSNDFCFYLEI